MRRQCVPGPLFGPGDEANSICRDGPDITKHKYLKFEEFNSHSHKFSICQDQEHL